MTLTCVSTVTDSEFDRRVWQSPTPVLVDFYSDHCEPCRAIKPVLEALCQERDDVQVMTVSVPENLDISLAMKIRAVPTLILFKEGEVAGKVTGLKSKTDLNQWIDEALQAS